MVSSSATTPLLSAEGTDDPGTMMHHHDHYNFAEGEESSDFTRLLAINHNQGPTYDDGMVISGQQHDQHPFQELAQEYNQEEGDVVHESSAIVLSSKPRRTDLRLMAVVGTLILLQAGFVWGSFLSNTWTTVYVKMTVSLAFVETLSGRVGIASTNLAALLQQLGVGGHYLTVAALWTTSLLLPCAFMIFSPTWLFFAADKNTRNQQQQQQGIVRPTVELLMRTAWLMVYCLLLQGLAARDLNAEWSLNNVVSIRQALTGGWAAFLVGTCCAVSATVVLRWYGSSGHDTQSSDTHRPFAPAPSCPPPPPPPISRSSSLNGSVRQPPLEAFTHPWRLLAGFNNSNHNSSAQDYQNAVPPANSHVHEHIHRGDDYDDYSMRVLEEPPQQDAPNATRKPPEKQTPPPEQQPPPPPEESASQEAVMPPSEAAPPPPASMELSSHQPASRIFVQNHPTLTWCRRVAVFQSGVLSLILWIPVLWLPFLDIQRGGWVGHLMGNTGNQNASFTLSLWELPGALWQQNMQAGTPRWAMGLGAILCGTSLVLIPLAENWLGLVAWILKHSQKNAFCCHCGRNHGSSNWAMKTRKWLYILHPALGSLVFGLALIVTVKVLYPMTAQLWFHPATPPGQQEDANGESAALITKLCNEGDNSSSVWSGGACLELTAHLRPGAFLYILHALLLEIFVMLTLKWT